MNYDNKLTKIFLTSFLIFIFISFSLSSAAAQNFSNPELLISAAELNSLIESENPDLRIIDVRNSAKYLLGHLPDAVQVWGDDFSNPQGWVPGLRAKPEEFAAVMQEKGVNNDSKIIVYDDNNGPWSARLWWIFRVFDHQDIYILEGGYDGWKENDYETEMLPHNPEKGNFVVQDVKNEWIVNSDTIAENLDNPDYIVLDTRTEAEFLGEETNSAAPRKGRIPNSVHVEWDRVLNEDNSYKNAEEIMAIYQEAGVTKDKETIAVLGHTGARAAHSFLVLKLLGYENLKLYDESWVGWSNRSDLPVEMN